jgi:SAM-dependent methyltransferase
VGHRGIRVLATDLSPAMLALTAHKAAAAGLGDAIRTHRLMAGGLWSLIDEYGRGSFDGAYSSFGPLNGEPDLRVVARALATLIHPGGLVVVSVMNRFYPFEICWYVAHGRFRQAVRRWRGWTISSVSPSLPATVPTWYYTPGDFERAFAPDFVRTSCRALPLLLPPPFLAHLWLRFPKFVHRLTVWEARLAHRPPFYALGDHFLVILKRRGCDTRPRRVALPGSMW